MAVFEDDCLGEVRILALLVIIPVAVEREHDVRVLLDGAGLTEVGQHRALILARLVGTRQLRQADDRNIELLGHDLEHAAHVGDGLRAALIRPAVAAAGRLHELQIVDDDKAKIRDAAALGVHVRNGQRRVVVDADIRRADGRGRGADAPPLVRRELAGQKLLAVDQTLAREQARRELLARHFEREHRNRLAGRLADVQGNVERKARLAHAGTGRDEDELARVQTENRLIQIRQAGGKAGDAPAAARRLGEVCIHALDDHADWLQAADIASLPERIDLALGRLEHGVRSAGTLKDHGVDLIGRRVQIAQQRLIAHDGRVLEHVRSRGRDLHDLHEVLLRRVLVHTADLHLLEHRDRVHALPVGEHGEDGVKNIAVGLNIKFVGLDLFDHVRDAARVDEHRTDDCLLRRSGMGRLSAQQLLHDGSLPRLRAVYFSSMTSTWIVPVTS